MNHNKLSFPILTILLLSFQISFCQEEFEKLPEAETNKTKIEVATNIANLYFESLKNGNPYDFTDQATEEFEKSMTSELQEQTYQELKQTFGDFNSLTYSGTWVQKETNEFQVIRFKGYFEKGEEPLEIRVVMNNSDKIAGFWIKIWKDNLNDS